MTLEADAVAFLKQLADAGARPIHTLSPTEARAAMRTLMCDPAAGSRVELASVDDRTIPGPAGPLGARVYTPIGDGPLPLLVYFHGGGFALGDLDTADAVCRELAARAGRVVVSVDYRLAPEHPFPAAVDDSLGAVRWVHANAEALRGDRARIVAGGDSAGATLSAVVALALRDEGANLLEGQLLIYPMTDAARTDWPSRAQNARGPLLTVRDIDTFMSHYLGSASSPLDPRVSPLRAARLDGLVPALVQICDLDPLRDEGLAYADALSTAGVTVTQRRYPQGMHGHFSFFAKLETGARMMDDAIEWLRKLGPVSD